MKPLFKIIDSFIRWILWGILFYGAYSETGPYTTAMLVIIGINIKVFSQIETKKDETSI